MSSNPFLQMDTDTERETERLSLSDLLGENLDESGPAEPLGTPPTGLTWPRDGVARDRVAVVSLHGGSGATTVTELIGPDVAYDAGQVIPESGPVIFVARTSGVGLSRLSDAARAWSAREFDGVTVLGAVLVASLPKIPKTLRSQARAASRMLPRTWSLEWDQAWYEAPEASMDALNLRGRSTRKALRRECLSAVTPGGA